MSIPKALANKRVHFVGIKGTGMACLAALVSRGVVLSGSDTGEPFYTDQILKGIDAVTHDCFDGVHIAEDVEVVIRSTAWTRENNPEVKRAEDIGIPVYTYAEVLGMISRECSASGIAGTHGKTTTTAMFAVLCRELGVPVTVLVPSIVAGLEGGCVYPGGGGRFVTETCEYRGSFLSYRPICVALTCVEAEHLDYFGDLEGVYAEFGRYLSFLPADGSLVYNADDPGCAAVIERAEWTASPRLVEYGTSVSGPLGMHGILTEGGRTRFRLRGVDQEITLNVPGVHNVYNATAALGLLSEIMGSSVLPDGAKALSAFRGSKRRSEVVGEVGGVLVVDDYGHHPTEVATTLAGLRAFYPERRLIVDFMPHLYSRTDRFFDAFVKCFDAAEEVVLHDVYGSAREEAREGADGRELGRALYDAVSARRERVWFFQNPLDGVEHLIDTLSPGDLLVTMGAGDNWRVGLEVLRRLERPRGEVRS